MLVARGGDDGSSSIFVQGIVDCFFNEEESFLAGEADAAMDTKAVGAVGQRWRTHRNTWHKAKATYCHGIVLLNNPINKKKHYEKLHLPFIILTDRQGRRRVKIARLEVQWIHK